MDPFGRALRTFYWCAAPTGVDPSTEGLQNASAIEDRGHRLCGVEDARAEERRERPAEGGPYDRRAAVRDRAGRHGRLRRRRHQGDDRRLRAEDRQAADGRGDRPAGAALGDGGPIRPVLPGGLHRAGAAGAAARGAA